MNNRLLLTFIGYALFFQQASSQLFEDRKTSNILTIVNEKQEETDFIIKKVTKTRLTAGGKRVIVIHTFNENVKCVIPVEEISHAPRPTHADCESCLNTPIEVEKFYSEMFMNRINPHITCDIVNNETIGFSYSGRSEIQGETKYIYHGLAISMPHYIKRGKEAEKENVVEEFLGTIEKVLIETAL